MKLDFHSLAILVVLVCFALAAVWMFVPEFLLSGWGVEFSTSAGLVGRRAAALFAGIGVMFYVARNAEASSARSALVKGFVAACLTLAALGVFELLSARAAPGILSAVFIEIALALAFLYIAHAKKPQPRKQSS